MFEGEKTSVFSSLKSPKITPQSFLKLPFEKIKDDILGKKYELSIVLIGPTLSKKLNSQYRNKNYATDVLSFEVSKEAGEIFITPNVASKKAKDFDETFENYLLLLLIHGCLHLKGMDHGSKMERYERTYYSRYRRRYL